jgi:electron transport complex protein RnfG
MSAQMPAQAAMPPVWPMYRAMVGIGVLCGLLIVGVYHGTRPVIERNRAAALQRAIFDVLPGARSSRSFRFSAAARFESVGGESAAESLVHAGYDAEGRLVGLALPAQAMGYQDMIRALYGYQYERQAIVGIKVLESRETPGLGDRIETDPAFQENFTALDVALGPDGTAVAHPIEVVANGEKQHPWQIDGITGATISSVAIASALRRSVSDWIPRVHARRADFEGGALR